MKGECNCRDRCEHLPIELNQCSSNPLYKRLLSHVCQAKYEYELVIELM